MKAHGSCERGLRSMPIDPKVARQDTVQPGAERRHKPGILLQVTTDASRLCADEGCGHDVPESPCITQGLSGLKPAI
jgi:hypothetical protein